MIKITIKIIMIEKTEKDHDQFQNLHLLLNQVNNLKGLKILQFLCHLI